MPIDLLRYRNRAYYFGILLPLALNFSPRGLSAPPPPGFWWHAPHALPVWAANSGFALAEVGEINVTKAPAKSATQNAATTPETRTRLNACMRIPFVTAKSLVLWFALTSIRSSEATGAVNKYRGNTDNYRAKHFSNTALNSGGIFF